MTCPIILVLRPQLTFFCFWVIVALCRTSEIGIGIELFYKLLSRELTIAVFLPLKRSKKRYRLYFIKSFNPGEALLQFNCTKIEDFLFTVVCCYSKKIGHCPNFKMFSPTAPRFFLPRFCNLLVITFILTNCMFIYSFLKLYIFASRICLLLLIWVSVNNTCSS